MAKSKMSFLIMAVVGIAVVASSGASARSVVAPPGLTGYGRVMWNLDALLHDTFGSHRVYRNAKDSYPRSPENFSATFIDNAHSRVLPLHLRRRQQLGPFDEWPDEATEARDRRLGRKVPLTIRGSTSTAAEESGCSSVTATARRIGRSVATGEAMIFHGPRRPRPVNESPSESRSHAGAFRSGSALERSGRNVRSEAPASRRFLALLSGGGGI
jgi:hypothetical protein